MTAITNIENTEDPAANPETPEAMSRAQQRRLFASARNLGMTDQERLDFAEVILRKDIESWKDFTASEAGRLIDAFEGYEKITWMLLSREI
jgi:hypothetical protein